MSDLVENVQSSQSFQNGKKYYIFTNKIGHPFSFDTIDIQSPNLTKVSFPFDSTTTIFSLNLNSDYSYLVNIKCIVTGEKTFYYQGIATINNNTIDFPSDNIFSNEFSWKLNDNKVQFIFTSLGSFHVTGTIEVLSDDKNFLVA